MTGIATFKDRGVWHVPDGRFLMMGARGDRPVVHDGAETYPAGIVAPTLESIVPEESVIVFSPDGVTNEWETNLANIRGELLTVTHDNGFSKIAGGTIKPRIDAADYGKWMRAKTRVLASIPEPFSWNSYPGTPGAHQVYVFSLTFKLLMYDPIVIEGFGRGDNPRLPRAWIDGHGKLGPVIRIDGFTPEIDFNDAQNDRHEFIRLLLKFSGDSDYRVIPNQYFDFSRFSKELFRRGIPEQIWSSGIEYQIWAVWADANGNARGQTPPALTGAAIEFTRLSHSVEGRYFFGDLVCYLRDVGEDGDSGGTHETVDHRVFVSFYDSKRGRESQLSEGFDIPVTEITNDAGEKQSRGRCSFAIDSSKVSDWDYFDTINVWAQPPDLAEKYLVAQIKKSDGEETSPGSGVFNFNQIPIDVDKTKLLVNLQWESINGDYRYVPFPLALAAKANHRVWMVGSADARKVYLTFTEGSDSVTSDIPVFSDKDLYGFLKGADNSLYQVKKVVSSTEVLLFSSYQDSTVTDYGTLFFPKNKIFPSDLGYGEGFQPETYHELNGIGDPVFVRAYRNGLIVAFESGIFFVTGGFDRFLEDEESAVTVLSLEVGGIATRSLVEIDNNALMWLWTDGPRLLDDNGFRKIGEVIREWFSDVDPELISRSFGAFYSKLTSVFWCVPRRNGRWARLIFDMTNQAFLVHEDVPDRSYVIVPDHQGEGQLLIGTKDGNVLRYDEFLTNDGFYYRGQITDFQNERQIFDSSASFPTTGITPVGQKAHILKADGGYDTFEVTANGEDHVWIDAPLAVNPTGQEIIIGGIDFRWKSQTFRVDTLNVVKLKHLRVVGAIPLNAVITVETTSDFVTYKESGRTWIIKPVNFMVNNAIPLAANVGRGFRIKIEGVATTDRPFRIEEIQPYFDVELG